MTSLLLTPFRAVQAEMYPTNMGGTAIGYAQAAALAKEALKTGVPVRTLLVERGVLTAEDVDRILDAHGMTQPGVPGKN